MDIPIIDFSAENVNSNVDEKKGDFVCKLLCNSCLCVNRNLHEVTEEKLARFYLNMLREIPLCEIPLVCPSMCWECLASLKRAVAFKDQVQDSYRILQTYTNETLHECLISDIVRTSRLRIQANSPISFLPDEDQVQTQETLEVTVEESVYVKGELKSEEAEWSDGKDIEMNEDPTPDALSDSRASDSDSEQKRHLLKFAAKKRKKAGVQSKIKKAEKIVKLIKNGVKAPKKVKTPSGHMFLTIELSYDEMQTERQKEASKESYLKAEFKCEDCLMGFNYRRSFKVHNQTKHAVKLGDYVCPVCKSRMASVESFTAHYKRHIRRYECIICQKRTTDVKVMQQHYYSTHEISLKEYKCNLCGKISNSVDTHRYHKDTHKARVQCNKCDKTFSHRGGLLNHRLSVHELRNVFPCTECDKVFRWKTSLRRHLARNHLKDACVPAAAYCGECGISFASVCSYQRHLKNSLKHVTQDQLRYICDHCNRRYSDKTKLRDHIEEKHLHRTYQCQICNKPSKNRVALDQHIRNVHKGRPNNKMCHHCGKGFPTKVQLESHIRTHTGERPFICEFCPTTFSQQSNLYKHNRQVHLNIKSKRYPMCKKRKDDKTDAPPDLPQHPDPYRPVAVLHYSPERGLIM